MAPAFFAEISTRSICQSIGCNRGAAWIEKVVEPGDDIANTTRLAPAHRAIASAAICMAPAYQMTVHS
jgi:hypothetical protein